MLLHELRWNQWNWNGLFHTLIQNIRHVFVIANGIDDPARHQLTE